jgi:hypothetical protein
VAVILTKRATIHIGLSQEWFAKRRRAILIGWSTVLLGVAMFISSIMLFNQPGPPGQSGDLPVALRIFGLIAILGGAIYGLLAARMVTPLKIDDQLIWLRGACPAYLADLPEWPYRS